MRSKILELREKVLSGECPARRAFYELKSMPRLEMWEFIFGGGIIREHYAGQEVFMCAIANVKSGGCSEDCAFCAQSSRSKANIPRYDLIEDIENLVEKARITAEKGASEFCLVAAWKKPGRNSERILKTIERIKEEAEVEVAVSLGHIDASFARELKDAGAVRYNHNLETSEQFFPKICSTHPWRDHVRTVEVLKEAGLEVCSGGIIGMGESWDDRVDLAFSLRELDVEHIPVNILIPIPGTPLADAAPPEPLESLASIALFRYVNPTKTIIVAGGRERNLRDLQSYIFAAGANGFIGGDYLTTRGRSIEEDLQMVKDLGLKFRRLSGFNRIPEDLNLIEGGTK